MADYRDSRGNTVSIEDTALGSGGEGAVYRVVGSPGQVAKIWHNPTPRAAEKIGVMVRYPPVAQAPAPTPTGGGLFRSRSNTAPTAASSPFAWPQELLYDGSNRAVGFLMPAVDMDRFRESQAFFNPAARRRTEQDLNTTFNDSHLLGMARNLAEAVRQIHQAGHVIGDVNEKNVLINARSEVIIVDIDAIQINDPNNGKLYRCMVGREDYTPPRLQGINFGDLDREPNDDLFGLAVLIFKLIMGGYHPYMSRIAPDDEDAITELGEKIKGELFPYNEDNSVPDEYKQPVLQYQANWDNLRQEIKHLFCEAFDPFLLRTAPQTPMGIGERPTPERWVTALDRAIELLRQGVTTQQTGQQRGSQRQPRSTSQTTTPRTQQTQAQPQTQQTRTRQRAQPQPQPQPQAASAMSRGMRLALAVGVSGVIAVIVSWMFVGGFFFGSDSPSPPAPAAAAPPVVQVTPTSPPPTATSPPTLAAQPTVAAAAAPANDANTGVVPAPLGPLTLSLSKASAVANDTIIIEGSGFAADTGIPVSGFTINGAPLNITDASAQRGVVQTNSSGQFVTEARLWPLTLPAAADSSDESYTVMVQDSQGNVIESDVAILTPTMTLSSETARPLDHVTISGENWPLSTRNREFQANVTIDGNTYPVPIDHNGRFTHEVRLSNQIALGVQHNVSAVLDGHGGRVEASAGFNIPGPVINLSSEMAAPGDAITVQLTNLHLDTPVHEVSISGINLLGNLNPTTDHQGNAVIDGLLIPSISEGFHDVRVVVGTETVLFPLAVLPDPATPTPPPYPNPALLEQRGSLPSQLARAPGVGQHVSGCFVGAEPRQKHWTYLADRPSATLESASNPIILDFHKSIAQSDLRELIPGKCYYVGPVQYVTDDTEERCPGTVYGTSCYDAKVSGSYRIYVTGGTLREITEAPEFGN